jgi:hypothetical protein
MPFDTRFAGRAMRARSKQATASLSVSALWVRCLFLQGGVSPRLPPCGNFPERNGDNKVVVAAPDGTNTELKFDSVLASDATQADVFGLITPLLGGLSRGVNASVLAYGQSGSGKTTTVEGFRDASGKLAQNDGAGIAVRTFRELFSRGLSPGVTAYMTFLEITSDEVRSDTCHAAAGYYHRVSICVLPLCRSLSTSISVGLPRSSALSSRCALDMMGCVGKRRGLSVCVSVGGWTGVSSAILYLRRTGEPVPEVPRPKLRVVLVS